MRKGLYQMILLVFFLYVPINPYNAKAVFIELKETTQRAHYVYFINRK